MLDCSLLHCRLNLSYGFSALLLGKMRFVGVGVFFFGCNCLEISCRMMYLECFSLRLICGGRACC